MKSLTLDIPDDMVSTIEEFVYDELYCLRGLMAHSVIKPVDEIAFYEALLARIQTYIKGG